MERSAIGRSILPTRAPAICAPTFGQSRDAPSEIGVLAKRRPAKSLERWELTTECLTRIVPDRSFAIAPLSGVRMLDDPKSVTVFARQATTIPSCPGTTRRLDRRVLLAEDGPSNQRLIAHVLKEAGVPVTVVENGKLALEAALAARERGNPFDLILMYMHMPVMDGYEAAGLLRQQGCAAPIIALTAHSMAGDRETRIQTGRDDYATKPIDGKKLTEAIQGHVCPMPAQKG